MRIARRQAIKLLGLGTLGAAAWGGRRVLLPPARSAVLDSVDRLAVRLVDSFDAQARALACLDYEHPFRQYHNRGVAGGGVTGWSLGLEQRQILTDLMYAGLSERGRSRIPEEMLIDIPGVLACRVLVCGDPRNPPYQIVLSAPHLNLRLGGASREGVAFGGPQVYGDQRGDEKQGLPGNLYRYQFETAHRLFAGLTLREQRRALLPAAPIQTQIELQGSGAELAGVAVAELGHDSKELVKSLLDGILSTYGAADAAYAWRCLNHNGGIDALHLSYYADGEVDGSGQYQIFRLEGPAAVFYFRGYPHLHAFINVAMNGDAPLSVGAALGNNPEVLAGAAVKRLFERAMRSQTGSDIAYYSASSVVGKLRAGAIRTGDIYNLESWQERVIVGEIQGARVPADAGLDLDPQRTYVLATTGFHAGQLRSFKGQERRMLLRDATIEHVRRHGLA